MSAGTWYAWKPEGDGWIRANLSTIIENDVNKTALWAFVDSDDTNKHKFMNITYMCADFSYDFQRNASKEGMEVYVAMGRKYTIAFMPS